MVSAVGQHAAAGSATVRAILVVLGAGAVCGEAGAAVTRAESRYAFYRSMHDAPRGSGRRMFGGRAAPADAWGAVCALLDRFWTPKCSGAVVAPRWALTAAHCVSPRLAYVKYNARYSSAAEGDAVPVQYLYRHPEYKVVQRDEGRGMDVTTLHNDVGLVRTRADMVLSAPPPLPVVDSMQLYDPYNLTDQEVDVLGFGRTESESQGEELYATRLVLAACRRGSWYHVVCGAARRGARAAGVCAGDSGGPVLYRGAQVAVTSMGPVECAAAPGPPRAEPAAASVFTALLRYAPLINATITDADAALRMTRIDRGSASGGGDARARLPLHLLCIAAAHVLW